MNDRIFTITTIENPKDRLDIKGGTYKYRSTRTVGYLFNFKEAEETLVNNAGDRNEAGHYPLAIIECYPEGIYACACDEYEAHWYEWNTESEMYQKIDCPEEFSNTIGFGMS